MLTYKFKNPTKFKQIKASRRGPDKRYVSGWGHYRTAPVMCALIEKINAKSFVEMGSCGCQLSETILNEFPNIKVYSVDVNFGKVNPNSNRAGQLIEAPIDRIKEEFGDRYEAIELPSVEAVKKFRNESLDIVYLDGYHVYKAVKEDIRVWHPKVTPNGILCGHDYNHGSNPGVKRAVDEMLPKVNVADYYNWWVLKSKYPTLG